MIRWLGAALPLLAGSCEAAYEGAALQQRTNPCPDGEEVCDIPVLIEESRVALPVGVAVGVWVEVRSSTPANYGSSTTVSIASDDPSVLEILPIAEREEEWMLVARSVGMTCISITVDDTVEKDCVDVNVNAQEDP